MEKEFQTERAVIFSVPIAVLVAIASMAGLWGNVYARETPGWAVQAYAQDLVDLIVIVPVLLVTSLVLRRGSRTGLFVWLGTMLYNLYTFAIYCFAVHFNALFLVYCWSLGLTVYGLAAVAMEIRAEAVKSWLDAAGAERVISMYLSVMGVMFYALWLREDLPALLSNKVPQSLTDAGIPTNPVHVIDLSVCLPGFLVTAILLIRKRPLGYLLAPSLLVFTIVMDVALGAMMLVLRAREMTTDLTMPAVFGVLTLISIALLLRMVKHPAPVLEAHSHT